MTEENTQENTVSQDKVKELNNKEQLKSKDGQMLSKMKKKRKSTAQKLHGQNSKQDNQISNEKQIKLTQLWKSSNVLSQSISKNNTGSNETFKKKVQQQIQSKNRKITELRKQRDQMQKKFISYENETKKYQIKIKQNFKQVLLQMAKNNRTKRGEIIPTYGYFKDTHCSNFVQGLFLKQIKVLIQQKVNQIDQLKNVPNIDKKDKQIFQFREKFLQKQLDQMNQTLKEREKVVLAYRQRLKFAQKENNCYYARIGWPCVGQDQRYQTLQLLGSGGFGQVYKSYDFVNNCYVALKYNKFSNNGARSQQIRQEFLKHVLREVNIQKNLHHPNIAKFVQIIKTDESEVSFVIQYCEGPQLSKYLKKYQCLQQKQAKQIIKQILCALKYLYEQDNKIIHYDLKPSNIMFHRGVVKILDFGLCKQMQTDQTRMNLTSQGVGTYWYLPPETFVDGGAEVSCKVDVWSVGVIFYQLLYGRRPFGHGISQTKIMQQGIILNAIKVQFPQQTPLKYKVSQAAKKFITQCLKYEQKQRLSPNEAFQHEYFK